VGLLDILETSYEEAASSFSGNKPLFVPFEDGQYEEGGMYKPDARPRAEGAYLDPGKVPDIAPLGRTDRYEGGFFALDSEGHPLELKYRLDGELRDYPETCHLHNHPEAYLAVGGSFRLGKHIGSPEDLNLDSNHEAYDLEDWYTHVLEPGKPYEVDAGVLHAIQGREPGTSLFVARGDPEKQEPVGKWDWRGSQVYGHLSSKDISAPGF